MIKYVFLDSPYISSWLDVTIKLYKSKIAEPIIFIGYDSHFKDTYKGFGKNVLKDFTTFNIFYFKQTI